MGKITGVVNEMTNQHLVPYYLMASYLYYIRDMSLLSDTEYDKLCIRLDKEWDNLEHAHKYLIDRESLSSTTGFTIKNYPIISQVAAFNCYSKLHKGDSM